MLTNAASSDSHFQRLELRAVRAAEWLQDLVFPPSCGHCGRVDYRFCPDCLHELEQVPVALARKPVEELDELYGTGAHCGVLQNAVQAFKYDGARDLAMPLADRLVEALPIPNLSIHAVAPVPLFADREAERGYNQSDLLCWELAMRTGIPARPGILKRVRETVKQAQLSKAQERRENVRDAFAASAYANGLSVLLVDDVATTGSTLSECAKALRKQGAERVYGIAVSHSLSSDWIPQEEDDEYQYSWRWDQNLGGA